MSVYASRSLLMKLTEDLSREWVRTTESWRDQKSREFEREYLENLFTGVTKTVAVLERLEQVIRKIKADCE